MSDYKPRIVDSILAGKLAAMGGVLIQGPKWCGKTTTAEQQAASVAYMADPENIVLAQVALKKILEGDVPRLIDEWQVFPSLWDAARFEIDHRREPGQFIFTGSATPADRSKILHSGTGRFAWITMRTMSLFESGDSNGQVALSALFSNSNSEVYAESHIDIDRLAFLMCRGGWPTAVNQSDNIALGRPFDYVDSVVYADIVQADGVARNPERTMRIMKSLARHQGAQVSINAISADIASNEADRFSSETVSAYVNSLKNIFVTEDAPAWNPNLRSKTAIRSSDTRYFTDPSIATAVLGLGPDDLVGDLNTMGLIFETLCMRDLRVYAAALDGQVYHFRDKTGLECDAVVHLRNGKYGLVEMKLGGEMLIEQGAQSLNILASKIDTDKMRAPSFKMVLTGVGRYAYKRPDGVVVVPVGTLRN